MGKTYAQLHTPDGSKSELSSDFTTKYAHTPNLVASEPMTDLEEASDSTDTVVYAKDDKLGCGGMMGRCPLIVLFLFVALGVLIGVGVSTLLVCRRYVTSRHHTPVLFWGVFALLSWRHGLDSFVLSFLMFSVGPFFCLIRFIATILIFPHQ